MMTPRLFLSLLLPILLAPAPGSLPPPQPPLQAQEPGAEEQFLLRMVMTIPVREGRSKEANQLARHMINYVRANYADVWRVSAYRDYSDEMTELHWVLECRSMSAMEQTFELMERDEGWVGLEQRMGENFVEEETELGFLLADSTRPPIDPRGWFRWERVARTTLGNYARALRHAREVARYVESVSRETYIEIHVQEWQGFAEIHWSASFESSDAWLQVRNRLLADEGYLDILEGAAGLFVDGTARDLLRVRLGG